MTNKPRGFGFVTFKEQEAADRAFQDEHVLDGRTVSLTPTTHQGLHCCNTHSHTKQQLQHKAAAAQSTSCNKKQLECKAAAAAHAQQLQQPPGRA